MSARKKRVVIVGSKPGAEIPSGDVIYCANAAIGYYADSVRRFSNVVSVLNPDLIHPKEFRDGVPNRELNERQRDMIFASRPDRLILTRTSSLALIREVLDAAGYSAPVTGISVYDRRLLVGRISGCYDPIVTTDFFHLPNDLKIRYAGSLASTLLKRLLDRRKDCGSAFRPSTGILSLVLAINEHGHNAEYVICGVGVNKRVEYLDGNNERQRALPAHVLADLKVLRRLARHYAISTTEPEMLHLLPLFNTPD